MTKNHQTGTCALDPTKKDLNNLQRPCLARCNLLVLSEWAILKSLKWGIKGSYQYHQQTWTLKNAAKDEISLNFGRDKTQDSQTGTCPLFPPSVLEWYLSFFEQKIRIRTAHHGDTKSMEKPTRWFTKWGFEWFPKNNPGQIWKVAIRILTYRNPTDLYFLKRKKKPPKPIAKNHSNQQKQPPPPKPHLGSR